jgi:L-asparaginase/Glu-tRNA(Gln) amidotransferase subunit D
MAAVQHPESRVLIIMTGGTICMKESPQGLIPATGFMDEAMRPRPSFNDGSICGTLNFSIQFIFSECEPREIKRGE